MENKEKLVDVQDVEFESVESVDERRGTREVSNNSSNTNKEDGLLTRVGKALWGFTKKAAVPVISVGVGYYVGYKRGKSDVSAKQDTYNNGGGNGYKKPYYYKNNKTN